MTRSTEIKDRIKLLRKSKNLSQAEFAEMIGCTKSQVAQWEVGNNYPKLENLIKLARVFEVTTDWILMGNEGRDAFDPKASGVEAGTTSDSWKDNHIAYLKERIRELEKKEMNTSNLKANLDTLQEFVLEQFSDIAGKNYHELRIALIRKADSQPIGARKYSILTPSQALPQKASA